MTRLPAELALSKRQVACLRAATGGLTWRHGYFYGAAPSAEEFTAATVRQLRKLGLVMQVGGRRAIAITAAGRLELARRGL